MKVLASSTANAASFSPNLDDRNLATDNSAILVVASNQSELPSNPNVEDFTFRSYLPVNSETIQIISIENNSILTEQTQLLNPSGNTVTGTKASVTIQNVDLSGLLYSDYFVKLNTKTVTDISNLAQLSNGWIFTTTNPSVDLGVIQGTPLKTSVLYDDYLFMTNNNGLDICMNYAFEIANPIITSTQAIKRTVKITFKDVSDNLVYDQNNTVFNLDDQDITISDLTETENIGVSCTDIVDSSLNGGAYDITKYRFRKYTKTSTYTATFDSKFPFYTNLLFKTPTITEQSVYYKIYDLSDNEQPSYLLKNFMCDSTDQLLSDVHVSFPNGPYSTDFVLTPSICSIFNAELEGTYLDGNIQTVPITNSPVNAPTNTVPLDPFFKLTSIVNGIDNEEGTATITVKFNNNITVNKLYYVIETQNAPGTNIALHGKKFVFNVSNGGNALDSFTPYNDFFNTFNMTDIRVDVSNNVGGNQTVTIYDTNNTTVLATVVHGSNFINNYNIIVCLWPFAQVVTKYNNVQQSDLRLLAINNTLNVDEGVYYHLNNAPAINAQETFRLMSESFKLRFVDNSAFPNNLDSTYNNTNGVLFTESIINTPIVSANGSNHARSVQFRRLRGWQRPGSGLDNILLDRSLITYTFSIDISGGGPNVNSTRAVQTFSNINVGTQLTVNAVVGQGTNTQTYDLGLKINPTQSMIGVEDEDVYIIHASVANFLANVDSNPYNPSIIDIVNNGYITDNQQLDIFYPYITGVKANCIKSYGSYTITITREIPDLKVYALTTANFIGDPRARASNEWSELGQISFNIFAWRGYVASNLNVFRRNNFIMFYSGYTSYYVVAPPSIDVYGYKYNTNVRSVPIRGFSPVLFRSFDINNPVNLYKISSSTNTATSELRLSQPTVFSYARYLNNTSTKYRFQIQGNKVRIAIYNGGVGNYGTDSAPDTIDANSNPYEFIYPHTHSISAGYDVINNIQTINNVYNVSLDASLNYNISYNQYLPGIANHHSTENIVFNIGNAFNGIPPGGSPGYPSMYLRLKSSQGTNVTFYQANIVYNDISGSNGYYMVIDKYNTDSNVNYNSILNGSIREVYFPVASHYTKQIPLTDGIVDVNGNIINQSVFVDQVDLIDVSNVSWVRDNTFTLQYIGLTISAITNSGISALGDLLKYNSDTYLQSKALYVRRQDIIRVLNVLGNTTYRVTNSGNVQSQRVTTSAVSLYYPANTPPEILGGTIGGAQDIISIFAQDTLITSNSM